MSVFFICHVHWKYFEYLQFRQTCVEVYLHDISDNNEIYLICPVICAVICAIICAVICPVGTAENSPAIHCRDKMDNYIKSRRDDRYIMHAR